MLKIYHNPHCKKSRAALNYLEENSKPFEVFPYMKTSLPIDEIKSLLQKLNLKPFDLVRTQEVYFKSSLKGKSFNEHEWLKILEENPQLIKRPIIVDGNKAILGDSLENLASLLNRKTKLIKLENEIQN